MGDDTSPSHSLFSDGSERTNTDLCFSLPHFHCDLMAFDSVATHLENMRQAASSTTAYCYARFYAMLFFKILTPVSSTRPFP